jgi:hypothetical protein
MNDIQKKNVCEILDASGSEIRKALDVHFRDLKLWEPTPEDYQLLDSVIATIQESIWTSDEHEFDYEKLKTEIYEALHGGGKAETEELEDHVDESEAGERDRAVTDFTFDWLRCILDKDVNE